MIAYPLAQPQHLLSFIRLWRTYIKACPKWQYTLTIFSSLDLPKRSTQLSNLQSILSRLEKAGLCLRCHKCTFLMKTVEYQGHNISSEGLRPNIKKVEAAIAAPTPTDVTQLRSFLWLMKFYGKFLPNLSSVMAPLHKPLFKVASIKKFMLHICATVVVRYKFHLSQGSIFTLFKFCSKKRIFNEHLTFRFGFISQNNLHITIDL